MFPLLRPARYRCRNASEWGYAYVDIVESLEACHAYAHRHRRMTNQQQIDAFSRVTGQAAAFRRDLMSAVRDRRLPSNRIQLPRGQYVNAHVALADVYDRIQAVYRLVGPLMLQAGPPPVQGPLFNFN